MPSGSRVTYLDSSALVKLAVAEPQTPALRRYLTRRRPLVSSALARTEVARALFPLGEPAARRAVEVLSRIDLVRINERVLADAGGLPPPELRSLDAIHLATARLFGRSLARLISYDERLTAAAQALGLTVVAPS